jgi:hypothetical protein
MSPVQGTRLMLRVNSVPAGGQVFVTVCSLSDYTERCCFQLTEGDVHGNGAFRAVEVSSTRMIDGLEAKFAEATLSGTTAFATWECIHSIQSDKMVAFAVIIAVPAQVDTNIDAITVNGHLAPLSNLSVASSHGPVPRFGNDSTPITILEFV